MISSDPHPDLKVNPPEETKHTRYVLSYFSLFIKNQTNVYAVGYVQWCYCGYYDLKLLLNVMTRGSVSRVSP